MEWKRAVDIGIPAAFSGTVAAGTPAFASADSRWCARWTEIRAAELLRQPR